MPPLTHSDVTTPPSPVSETGRVENVQGSSVDLDTSTPPAALTGTDKENGTSTDPNSPASPAPITGPEQEDGSSADQDIPTPPTSAAATEEASGSAMLEEFYEYQPLDDGSIRLLHLDDSYESADGLICCSLQSVVLKSLGLKSFQTISHAWGKTFDDKSHLTHRINCNGRPLLVTKSIFTFLSNWKMGLHPFMTLSEDWSVGNYLPMWLDSVCINQQDDQERSLQVAQMGEIYQRSFRLVIWLGEGFQETAFFDMFDGYLTGDELLYNIKAQHEIRSIFKVEWFRRRWTIQELGLTLPYKRWLVLNRLAIRVETLNEQLRRLNPEGFRKELDYLTDYLEPRHWLSNMEKFASHRCSDWRDLIFSMANICKDKQRITPSYVIGWKEVYVQFANRLLYKQTISHLLVSAAARVKREGVLELPSWVPDWRQSVEHNSQLHDVYEECSLEGHESYCNYRFKGASEKLLHVEGLIVLPRMDWVTEHGLQQAEVDDLVKDAVPWEFIPKASRLNKDTENHGYLFLPGCPTAFRVVLATTSESVQFELRGFCDSTQRLKEFSMNRPVSEYHGFCHLNPDGHLWHWRWGWVCLC